MSIVVLVWNYLKGRPLNTALNTVLLSLGVSVIVVLIIVSNQLEQKIEQNSRGIDLVVGAKGSPLQLILCNIFHIDFPTGNINLAEAERIARNRLVKNAIPLALGDSYQTFRIIGTTLDYAGMYDAELASGGWWEKDMEVTLGSMVAERLNKKEGDTFISAHGLSSGGHNHEESAFIVSGILKPTHTVLDNLILTNVGSIWEIHGEHRDEQEHDIQVADTSLTASPLIPSVPAGDSTMEITSMLLQYRSPMAAIQLPRMINSQTNMQAASPAFETARLFTILGVGVDLLMVFAYVLIAISGLSIFIALYNSLKERRYDLAIMRTMGASRGKLVASILLEGSVLTFMGSVVGLLIGHGVMFLLAGTVDEMQRTGITGILFYEEEWILLAGSLLLGTLCALIPGIQAYKTDISRVLASQ